MSADGVVVAALSILLLSSLHQAAPSMSDAAEKADDLDLNAGAMFLGILFQLIICAVLLFYLRNVRYLNPLEIFGLKRLSLSQAAGTAALFMVPTLAVVMSTSLGVNAWMQSFWPDLSQQATVQAFQRSTDPLAKFMLIIAAVIVAPIVEETVFRGFIYGVIKRFTDSWFAAFCSALLFAVVHFHIGSLIPLTVLALVLCAAYERTGSLVVPMMMHGLFNGTSIALMIFVPNE